MVTLVYHDRQNTFRNPIIKNLLQCFFLNMYDKTQKFFASEKKDTTGQKRFFTVLFPSCRNITFNKRKSLFTPMNYASRPAT